MSQMFVMLPVMLYARKLDAEDPNTVLLIRCAYGKSIYHSIYHSI